MTAPIHLPALPLTPDLRKYLENIFPKIFFN